MVSRGIGPNIRPGFENEVANAIGFHMRKEGGAPATDEEFQDWLNRHIDAAVFKYREKQAPGIDRQRPTSPPSPPSPGGGPPSP